MWFLGDGCIFFGALGALSHVMLNGGVTKVIPSTRSLKQRCPLSPSLFVIVTQPNLANMHELGTFGKIVGLAQLLGKQFIMQVLARDSFFVFQSCR